MRGCAKLPGDVAKALVYYATGNVTLASRAQGKVGLGPDRAPKVPLSSSTAEHRWDSQNCNVPNLSLTFRWKYDRAAWALQVMRGEVGGVGVGMPPLETFGSWHRRQASPLRTSSRSTATC
jgi:hypothetical protein